MSKIAWTEINWTLVQDRVSRQQKRVYRARVEGNIAKVQNLQRRIIASLDAKFLAIRYVTEQNKEYNNVDLKAISHKKKIELAYQLKLDGKINSAKRNYTKKPINIENQLSCILTVNDRAKQMLVKLALEPEWEAIFKLDSYGFSPARSYHDAVTKLFFSLKKKPQYVFSVNVKKCFDIIDYDKFRKKVSTFDMVECQIKAWLKTNIMMNFLNKPHNIMKIIYNASEVDILSPLLVNIALHGLEDHIRNWYVIKRYPIEKRNVNIVKRDLLSNIGFIRYADDFVITASELVDIIEIEKQVTIWLKKEVGLEVLKKKTKIVNSTEGFEFLGFQIISIKQVSGEYKIKIYPSKKSKSNFIQYTRNIIQRNRAISSFSLINLLSKAITQWADYFRYCDCRKDFSKMDYLIFNQVKKWVFRRKSKGLNSKADLKLKYFPEGNNYNFRGKNYKTNWILIGQRINSNGKLKENFLPKMMWIKSAQYIKVKGKSSIYDGNHFYGATRIKRYSELNYRVSKLIQIQNGCCTKCSNNFIANDSVKIYNILTKSRSGMYKYKVFHKHCYIQKN
jgi:RNA-directed DNA polymerase